MQIENHKFHGKAGSFSAIRSGVHAGPEPGMDCMVHLAGMIRGDSGNQSVISLKPSLFFMARIVMKTIATASTAKMYQAVL